MRVKRLLLIQQIGMAYQLLTAAEIKSADRPQFVLQGKKNQNKKKLLVS